MKQSSFVWVIKWRGEDVDEFDHGTDEQANYARKMLQEYNLAFGGGCSLVRRRIKPEGQ